MDINYIIRSLYDKELLYFTVPALSNLVSLKKSQIYGLLNRLKRKKLIAEVEKGKYLVLGFEPERVLSNPYYIATQVIRPSYVSFWTALHFYGFTEQAPRTILVATTRQRKKIDFEGMRFEYVTIRPYKFFGYRKEVIGDLPVLIADKEKALLDSLGQLDKAGGLREVAKALYNAKEEIEISNLIEYALKVKNKSLNSRLGYLLEKYGIENKGLEKKVSLSFVKLDPRLKMSKNWDKKWRINVNVNDEELFAWRKT